MAGNPYAAALNPLSMSVAGGPQANGLPPGYTYDQNGNIITQGGTALMSGPEYAGMPTTPFYNPIYNPQTQSLLPGVESQLAGIDLTGLDQSVKSFQDLADRQGPSAWATLANQQQNALAENARERGAGETNASTAAALDQLGSSGGITSGARERVAEAGQKNYMNMNQDVSRQNTLNQLQIGVNDQQNKMQEMGMLPGMEMQALQPEFQKANMWEGAHAGDIQNQIGSNEYANQWNQNLYNQQMSAWAANQQAKATANSGKK